MDQLLSNYEEEEFLEEETDEISSNPTSLNSRNQPESVQNQDVSVQSNQNQNNLSQNNGSENISLFNIHMAFYAKNFSTERRGSGSPSVDTIIACNNVDEFFEKTWSFAEPLVKQLVSYDEETNEFKWLEADLNVSDLKKVAYFQDREGRKSRDVNDVNASMMQVWTTRGSTSKINCFVQVNQFYIIQ